MKNYLLTIVSVLFFSASAFSASFVVNSNADTSDANLADNICADASGNCTLRAAVEQANAQSSDDVITFAAGLPTITLTTAADILINNSGTLQINGPGANVLTISAGTTSYNRVFNTNNATATIADLTLTDGGTTNFFCGCSGPLNGGAILVNGGSVTIQRVNVTGNIAGAGSPPSSVSGSGGGIAFNGGVHLIQNSTFSNNRSTDTGGAIYNTSADLTIVNSTISENSGAYQGGGIFNAGNLTLRNTTITNNFAYKVGGFIGSGYGGGIHNSGTLQFNNTIVAGNLIQNTTQTANPTEINFAGGTITSTGNNFIGDSAGDSTTTGTPIAYQPTDIRDIPPMLDALAYNGGTTPTRALLANSPAINAGNSNAPPNDQRGAGRVGAADIGAYEFGALQFSISGRVTSDGTNGLSGVTVTLSGSGSATTTTNANGDYSFGGLVEGGNYTITPTRANTVFSPQSVSFTNLNGNQTANFRPECVYSISPMSATFSASGGSGSISVTASVGCVWTAVSNNPEFITVTNGSGTGGGTATFTVAANSGSPRSGTITVAGQTFTVTQAALPTLSINNVSALEGNSGTTPFVFTVILSSATGATVTVNYATVNGTATPPTDYQGISGTLTFAPGETVKTVTVLVNGDTTIEPNETFTVNLTGANNAVIAVAQGIGTIRNDDGPTAAKTGYDYDGDGRADITVFRPSNGYWYELRSQSNGFYAQQFGQSGDLIAPADYDGDGKTDIAVWRGTVPGAGNSAYFYVFNSSDNSFRPEQFGATGDVPVGGDWDGDGKADLAVYREATTSGGQSYFFYRPSSQPGVDFRTFYWGTNGDKPLVGDFDGDGKLDAAVFRPSNAVWYILRSTNNQVIQQAFGVSTDIPVPADYDGDGITNFAVFRPSTGYWYTSTNPAINYGAVLFGASGDLPVPADYDGDGKADVAVFRPSNGSWYMQRSTAGFTGVQFGQSGDRPAPNAFVR